MHRLLERQLERHIEGDPPPELTAFIDAVNAAYHQSDADRGMLERSLELSSGELLQANSEMRAIFRATPDLFFRIESDGRIIGQRGANRSDFFLGERRLIGKYLQDIPVPSVALQLTDAIREAGETSELVSLEYTLSFEGVTRHFEARFLPVAQREIIVIIRNITERKEAETQLAEHAARLSRSNAELTQFASIASHDLQEPLRTVQSYLQLLSQRYAGKIDTDADEFIEFAVDATRRMRELISDLLAYSRVTSRAKPFEIVNPTEVLEEVTQSLQSVIREADARVTHDDLPLVNCDRGQIRQLFQNLISNGIKFRGERAPRVRVSARSVPEGFEFTVSDNGIGLEAEHVDRIFNIFERLHSRADYEGTGIGLAICKKIVERHGGRIWVESVPGEGASFKLLLDNQAEEERT